MPACVLKTRNLRCEFSGLVSHILTLSLWFEPHCLLHVAPTCAYLPAARSSRREFRDLGSHPLGRMMEVLLWNNPEHRRMKQTMLEW